MKESMVVRGMLGMVGGLRPNAIVVGSGELSGHAVRVVSLQAQE